MNCLGHRGLETSSLACNLWRLVKPADKSSFVMMRLPVSATSMDTRSTRRLAFGVPPVAAP